MFGFITRFFDNVRAALRPRRMNPAFLRDNAEFLAGTSFKKPISLTKFGPCTGTAVEVSLEFNKLTLLFRNLMDAIENPEHLNKACRDLSHQVRVVSAEWRTFFHKQQMDPLSMGVIELQQMADLGYNNWRNFLAAIGEFRHPTFRPMIISHQAIEKFIEEQNTAIDMLIARFHYR